MRRRAVRVATIGRLAVLLLCAIVPLAGQDRRPVPAARPDARAVAAALRETGFAVTEVADATQATLDRELTGFAAGVTWAYIPAGTFQMGCTPGDGECATNELPRHTVTLSKPFELMTTEVTVAMARASGRMVPAQPAWTRDDHPIVSINWDDASAICKAVGGRLPAEAEWEYAARGGQPLSRYPWGPEAPVCAAGRANGARFDDDAGCDSEGASTLGSVAVASYASNGHGLYDMAGNVWEWVADWYAAYANGAQTDPRGPASGSSRVLRGGSWYSYPRFLRVSYRGNYVGPSDRSDVVGVRCARDVSP